MVGDDSAQAKKVYKIFRVAESEKIELFVPFLVTLELDRVLESVYRISMPDILDSIRELLLMPILKFEQQSVLQQFVLSAQTNKYDLSDLLIAYSAKSQGCDVVVTFDKKASTFHLFELA